MPLVLYGSATGNASDLANVLVDRLRRRTGLKVEFLEFGRCTVAQLAEHRHVFVVCSTTGQGELPANTKPLWGQLLKRSLNPSVFSNVKLFTFGLGSSTYPKFNFAARKIHARLLQLGAQQALPRGEGDDVGPTPYESVFDEWMSAALGVLDSELQLTDVLPLTAQLPPLYEVQVDSKGTAGDSAATIEDLEVGSSSAVQSQVLKPATLMGNQRVTSPDHFQDVRLLRFKLDRHEPWESGDVLTLYPQNNDKIVDLVIESQGWDANSVIKTNAPAPEGGWCEPLTLRNLLLNHLDLNGIPSRQFFVTAQHFCGEERQRERMGEFATDLDDLFDYTSRPRRSVAEVILEFDTLKIPTNYILDVLPPLRPRQYSIANACLLPDTYEEVQEIELAVALVKYKTLLRRVRKGLCSRYLENLETGAKLFVSLEHSKLNLAQRVLGRPLIMVATGTGIAPIRALVQELRPVEHDRVLFYGCRGPTEDYSFADELKHKTKVVPAFSRHGGGYVQQQIAKYEGELDIENAFIFVCGSAGAMPRAVREAFVERLERVGLDAEKILQQKEKAGVYMQETW